MTKRKSILDLKRRITPRSRVAMRELDNGRWQVAIMFPHAIEALTFDRPTERGAENETIHQCRKRGYQGYKRWTDLEKTWANGD